MVKGITDPLQVAAQRECRAVMACGAERRPERNCADAADKLELSPTAREQLEAAPFRAELVERIRAELAAGRYSVEDKLDHVVERLYQRLLRQP